MTFFIGQTFKGTYPPEAATWCNANNAYIEVTDDGYVIRGIPAASLDEVKVRKVTALKEERDVREVEAIEYNGRLFDYDDKARDRINAAIIALDLQGEGASLSWTCADQSEAVVTANDLRMVIANVAVRANALHEAYRVAKDAVTSAETEEAVQAVSLEV